ncbi:MAG: tetratricopeptide repeat protein [Bacteroidales bacterium]
MKKIYLTVALSLLVIAGFAQKRNVNSAYNESWAEAPNFDNARKLIAEAMVDTTTANWVKTWAAAGLVEIRFFEVELAKSMLGSIDEATMYNALKNSYNYFTKAVALDSLPDVKGKVKPKYTKEIKQKLNDNKDYFYYGGGFFFGKGKDKEAYEFFNIYDELCRQPFMASLNINCSDTMHMQSRYFAAVMALKSGDNTAALKALKRSKDDNFNGLDVYNYIAYIYGQNKDTVNQIEIFKEGLQKFGADANREEYSFMKRIINIYINRNEIPKAIDMLQVALKAEPKDYEYWKVLGSLYYDQKDDVNAVKSLEKAIEVNPDYADAYGEIGRIYYNAAINENNKSNDIKDNLLYRKAKEEVVKPAFKKAAPFYEKALELKPEETGFLYNLKNIYYNINDGKNLERIEKLLNK